MRNLNLVDILRYHLWRLPRTAIYAGALVAVLAVLLAVRYQVTRPPGTTDLPDFEQQDTSAMKARVLRVLRAIAKHHNERIAEDREWLMSIAEEAEQDSLGWFERRRLNRLANHYRVDLEELEQDEAIALLKRRVDVVPESLVLIQAAKESGWGRSRFAREGVRCSVDGVEEGCGIVPGSRPEGADHEVESFPTVYDAVGSYLRNLNTNRSYIEMRKAREALREKEERLTGVELAEHLGRYSERGTAYVREIVSMIRQNDLEAVSRNSS
ncbi:MAG: glucosaminidase domain-containing protein [Woeseiaceae bacterium]|nr:glucosaminidase domain-containing protein [Woeseiaceae bacterium]